MMLKPWPLTCLLVSTTCLVATRAFAQMSPEEARAHADAVISRADASRWFTNVTTDDRSTVRHVPSGMKCEFVGQDDRDVIRLYTPNSSPAALGDDVSCGTWVGRTFVTVYATRHPQSPTEAEVFDAAYDDVVANWPQATAVPGPFDILTLPDQPLPAMAVFELNENGRPSHSLLLVRQIGRWSFKARATGPQEGGVAIEFGSELFALSLPENQTTVRSARP